MERTERQGRPDKEDLRHLREVEAVEVETAAARELTGRSLRLTTEARAVTVTVRAAQRLAAVVEEEEAGTQAMEARAVSEEAEYPHPREVREETLAQLAVTEETEVSAALTSALVLATEETEAMEDMAM